MNEPGIRRATDLNRLGSETFDLLIIGGGITGAGIARDAAQRGVKVALIDKGDFASGTSSKSSKLIHGGLRYLEQAHLHLVFEAVTERARLLRLAPHLVTPLEFVLPCFRKTFFAKVGIGLFLYDALARFRFPAGHHRYGASGLHAIEPLLRTEDLVGGFVYRDCQTDDARLTLETILDARRLGAVCLNHVQATGLGRSRSGRVEAVFVTDRISQESFDLRARVIIGALGPWTDTVMHAFDAEHRPLLRPTKGVHVIVERRRLDLHHAVTMGARDHRIVFAIPAGRRTIIGTTDTDFSRSADEAFATIEDVIYLLGTANFYFPEARLHIEDVISAYAGLRPLLNQPGSASSVSREHEIIHTRRGPILIIGGKLTTFRPMAEQLTDIALESLSAQGFLDEIPPGKTAQRPFPRAFAKDQSLASVALALEKSASIDREAAHHMARTYGSAAETVLGKGNHEKLDPSVPFLACELDFAIEQDLAVTPADVLGRRVPLLLYAQDAGQNLLSTVSKRLKAAHGFSDAQSAIWAEEFLEQVRRHHAFRFQPPPDGAGQNG